MALPRTWPRLGRWRSVHQPRAPRSSAPWIRPPPGSAARDSGPPGGQISAGHPQPTHARQLRRHHVGRPAYRFGAICVGIPSMPWMGMQAKRPAAPRPLGSDDRAVDADGYANEVRGFGTRGHGRRYSSRPVLRLRTHAMCRRKFDDKEQYPDL